MSTTSEFCRKERSRPGKEPPRNRAWLPTVTARRFWRASESVGGAGRSDAREQRMRADSDGLWLIGGMRHLADRPLAGHDSEDVDDIGGAAPLDKRVVDLLHMLVAATGEYDVTVGDGARADDPCLGQVSAG